VAIPRAGAESLLGLGPFQWLGKRSYSLYLLHWPILVIAAERVGKTSLPLWENLTLVGVALLLSMRSYVDVENRIRHWRLPSRKSVAMGVGTVVATVAVLTAVIAMGTTPTRGYKVTPVASTSALLTQVAAARSITTVPTNLTPSLTQYGRFWGGNYEDLACQAAASQWKERICTLGDPMAKRLMVVYGDSYALMWLPAFNAIARSAHWRLIVLSKPYCPAEFVTIVNQPSYGTPNGPDTVCNQWHTWALNRINAIKPSLLVITQLNEYETPGTATSPPALFPVDEWSSGLTDLLQAIRVPNVRKVFLGGTPGAAQLTPTCLANHLDDVQACSGSASNGYNPIERQAAISSKTEYVDTNPWYCTTICTPIIEKYCVYLDGIHITSVWAIYLQNVLAAALGIHFESTSSTYVLGTP